MLLFLWLHSVFHIVVLTSSLMRMVLLPHFIGKEVKKPVYDTKQCFPSQGICVVGKGK